MSLLKFFMKQGNTSTNDPLHDLPFSSCSSSSSSSNNNTCSQSGSQNTVDSLCSSSSLFRCDPPIISSMVNTETSQGCGADCECDTITDFTSLARVQILPSKPNQPKINFPKRVFGAHRRGFSKILVCNYPRLHYIQKEDPVLCFYCASAV